MPPRTRQESVTTDADEFRTLPERLRQVQEDVDDAEKALALRREARRRLVHQAYDEAAMTARQIAKALGRGTGLVSKILATPGPDD